MLKPDDDIEKVCLTSLNITLERIMEVVDGSTNDRKRGNQRSGLQAYRRTFFIEVMTKCRLTRKRSQEMKWPTNGGT